MKRWIKKLHMYTGLLNFTILMIFGISGVRATLGLGRIASSTVETRAFRVPPNLNDVQAADAAYAFLKPALSQPPLPRNIHRDANNNVTFRGGTINGPSTVTLLEEQNEIRIQTQRNTLAAFLDNLHSTTIRTTNPDIRIRMWSWYMEFAIWSLLFMVLSGVYLWLASRPGFLWGQICFVVGGGAFLLLYFLVR